MREVTFRPTSPRDFYDQFAKASGANADASNNFHFGNTLFTIGQAEFLWFDETNCAIISKRIYKEDVILKYYYQYESPWLLLIIQEVGEKGNHLTLHSILKKKEIIASVSSFSYETEVAKQWQQAENSQQHSVFIFLSEHWLKDKLACFFSQNDDFMKQLEAYLTTKNISKICQTPECGQILTELIYGIQNREPQELIAKQKKLERLASIAINNIWGNTYSDLPMKEKLEINGIMRAERYLLSDFSKEPLVLEELAKIAGVNRVKFQDLFKVIYGTTFYNHFQKARFSFAKELIENKNFNIAEASDAVGYKNVSHFSTKFEKYIGLKPTAVRKLARNTASEKRA
jgi:AraC-like DNA-binding protein